MAEDKGDLTKLLLIELLKLLSGPGIWRAVEPGAAIVAFIKADTDFLVNANSVVRRNYWSVLEIY